MLFYVCWFIYGLVVWIPYQCHPEYNFWSAQISLSRKVLCYLLAFTNIYSDHNFWKTEAFKDLISSRLKPQTAIFMIVQPSYFFKNESSNPPPLTVSVRLVYVFSEAGHYFYPDLKPRNLEVNKRTCCPYFGQDDLCAEVKQNNEINTQGFRVFLTVVCSSPSKMTFRICSSLIRNEQLHLVHVSKCGVWYWKKPKFLKKKLKVDSSLIHLKTFD